MIMTEKIRLNAARFLLWFIFNGLQVTVCSKTIVGSTEGWVIMKDYQKDDLDFLTTG